MGPLHAAVVMAALSWNGPTENVLYDFSATWCGPCQRMSPLVSQLEREGYSVQKIDVDRQRDLAVRYGVTSMPTFVLVINGKEVDRRVGMMSEQELRRMAARLPARTTQQPATRSQPQVAQTPARKNAQLPQGQLSAPHPKGNSNVVVRGNNSDAEDVRPDAEFLKVTVRIHVQDSQGANVGTGTIIDSRPGETLVLTCGHVFRNIDKARDIEVELFTTGKAQSFKGRYLKHDAEADVGLLLVATPQAMPVARVASASHALQPGDAVVSVGCGGGADPTVERIKVTALNRYLGPDNLECTGVPQQGRSGGGLFTPAGQVVGVCTAADPRDKKGLYCALKPIQDLLDTCNLSYVYKSGTKRPAAPAVPPPPSGLEVDDSPQVVGAKTLPVTLTSTQGTAEETATDEQLAPALAAALRNSPEGRKAAEQALAGASDAEIVCVIRPIGKPQAASRVVVIHRASEDFVSELTGELENQPEFNRTTLREPVGEEGTDAVEETQADAAPVETAPVKATVTVRANRPRKLTKKPGKDDTPRPFVMARGR